MTDLVEQSQFDTVYQLELTDKVLAGPNGIANKQAQQLANRTKYLKDQLEAKTGQATEATAGIAALASQAEALAGTDDKKIMTAFKVKAVMDALVNAAPGTLDTLNELAAALGDDPNFATTVTNALANKRNKPNRFSKNLLLNSRFIVNQDAISGTITLSAGQYGHDMWRAGASGCTYTFAKVNNVVTVTISAGSLQQEILASRIKAGRYYLSHAGTAQCQIDGSGYGESGTVYADLDGSANSIIEFGVGTVTKTQLELDSVTDYEWIDEELDKYECQFFYYKEDYTSLPLGRRLDSGISYSNNAPYGDTIIGLHIEYPRRMRTIPNLIIINGYRTGGTANSQVVSDTYFKWGNKMTGNGTAVCATSVEGFELDARLPLI